MLIGRNSIFRQLSGLTSRPNSLTVEHCVYRDAGSKPASPYIFLIEKIAFETTTIIDESRKLYIGGTDGMVTEEMNKALKEENKMAREYYHMEGIRRLFKAVGMQAIKDYGKAHKRLMKGDTSKMFDGKDPETVMTECEQYFNTEQFKAIFGITDPKDVCKKAIKYQEELENMKNMNEEERNKYVDELLHRKAV